MANGTSDNSTDDFLDTMLHEVTLNLSPCGGRVFVRSASKNNLNASSVELKCWWQRPNALDLFRQLSITIGDEKHKHPPNDGDDETLETDWEEQVGWRLDQCPIMLDFDEVTDTWLADSAERNGGEALKGQLSYYAPVDADEFGKDARPTVTVWVPVGNDNLKVLRDRILVGDALDISIGLTVQFPKGCVQRGDHGYGKSVQWDGEGALQVKDVVIVWKRHDWNSDCEEKPESVPEVEQDKPLQEHREIRAIASQIEASVAKLAIPLWLAVAVLVWIAIFR